jgi:hypothetical protein
MFIGEDLVDDFSSEDFGILLGFSPCGFFFSFSGLWHYAVPFVWVMARRYLGGSAPSRW